MPGQHLTRVRSFQVVAADFFNIEFDLPVAPPARPAAAARLACNFTLRLLTDSGRVRDSRSFTALYSEPFPYRFSTHQTYSLGDPIYLLEGAYRVELANRADTPAFQARGAELRFEPHTTFASVVLTQLALLAGAVLVVVGLLMLITMNRTRLSQRRNAA